MASHARRARGWHLHPQGTAAAVLPGLAFEENVKLLEQDDVPDPGRVVDGFIRVKSVGFGEWCDRCLRSCLRL